MDLIRYPIGRFQPQELSTYDRMQLIADLPEVAKTLRRVAASLTEAQLENSYRSDGWTVRQIIHHMADNDMNAYLRFKRALTEEAPETNSYREDLWAEIIDYKNIPVAHAIALLELIHARLFIIMTHMQESDFKRTLMTQALGTITLDIALQRLLWHNQHHLAQIHAALIRKNEK